MPDFSIAFNALRGGGFSIPELESGKFDIWDAHVQRLAAAINIPNLFTERLEDPQNDQVKAHLKWIKFFVIDLFLASTKAVRDAASLPNSTKYMDEPHNVYKYIKDCHDRPALSKRA